MIDINQDVLCDFCETLYGTRRDTCECTRCSQARENYLEDIGLIETKTNLPQKFSNLKIDDLIYILDTTNIPTMSEEKVNSLEKNDKDSLRLYSNGISYILPNKDCIKEGLFLSKKACQNALEAACVKMIIKLSKIIGNIKK